MRIQLILAPAIALILSLPLSAQDVEIRNSSDQLRIKLTPDGQSNGGQIRLYEPTGTMTMDIAGNHGSTQGSYINMFRGDGGHTIQLDAHHHAGGQFYLKNSAGDVAVHFQANTGAGKGASMDLQDETGTSRIILDTDWGLYSTSLFNLFLPNGINTVSLNTNIFSGGELHLRDGLGTETITLTGNPGTGGYHMKVDGKILSEEIRIEMSQNWPDYVFSENYPLTTLPELEKQIHQLGHLPGIPSADQVETEGFELGDMQKRLLEKVEELTLHLIDMDKTISSLQGDNAKLRKAINDLNK